MQNLMTITPLHEIGKDERGETLDFTLPRKQDNFIYLSRKAGSISGNTYHEGINLGTNPKIFVLISGTIKLSARHKDYSDIERHTLSKPCMISITPFITHKIEAITDIIMLECNSITDIQHDRYKLDVEVIKQENL